MKTLITLLGLFLSLTASSNASPTVEFPSSFKWCVATAAHQIEGGNTNSDWWDWEQIPGHVKNGERSGAACGHWDRLEEDTRLLSGLHVRQYRFSVEWAKVEPKQGRYDLDAIIHYNRELALLRAAGIEPMITLQHFTLPRWMREQGGWEWDGAPAAFAKYSTFVLDNIGFGVRDWITINEPMVHLVLGYLGGVQPPGKKGDLASLKAPVIGLLKAHAAAYHAMKQRHPEIRIGLAHHLRVFDAIPGWNPLNGVLAEKLDRAWNWAFAEALETGQLRYDIPLATEVNEFIENIAHTQDFIGINYYTRDMVEMTLEAPGFKFSVPEGAETSDVGWEIYPEGFYRVLKAAAEHFPGKQILITENGIADAKDTKRSKFIESHLEAMNRAMREGVPVEGYCYWSLMDNFEWSEGFTPRFGLYEMDYATLARKARPSAAHFSEIILRNGF
ncbi:MAG: family 1 glycosylhydrolase [Deltaproteobacteria bacterium]|nr:family 1 glycosylhydrolase [Deltaproteobacteria bacterium]